MWLEFWIFKSFTGYSIESHLLHYSVQTSNGIAHSESGQLKQVPGAETQSLSVQGQYEYETKEGEKVRISYIADENGYRAEGPHIPKA